MLNRETAKQVMHELQTEAFVCSESHIKTSNFVITLKSRLKHADKNAGEYADNPTQKSAT